MCRNIRVLHNFAPPSTPEEIHAAALQYVRKVSGLRAPTKTDAAAFEKAVNEVAEVTARLLEALPTRGDARTREREAERARQNWMTRVVKMGKG